MIDFLSDNSVLESIMEEVYVESLLSLPDDVPIGAAIYNVSNDQLVLVAKSHNTRESIKDPTNHAEINVIRESAKLLGDWRLDKCIMFTTLEPCIMCASTLVQSRIGAVVFGAHDEQYGACGSIYNFLGDSRLNHNAPVIGGILKEKCSENLKHFFTNLRT
jgi:tRNA(adenine34) deaminase